LLIQGAAKSGAGKLKLAGFVDFLTQPEWLVDLLLTGENFEVAKIPEAQIALSPALTIKAIGKQANISGTLSVPKAVLTVQEIPENAVKVSADEVILGAEVLPETPETSAGIDTDVVVELGQEVSFSGQGLTTHLQGRLNVANKAGKMVMNGAVDLNKATYKRFGQDLTVRKGRFLFNGPVDNPWLDIEAIRVSKSKMVTAVLSLSGPLRQPKTKIFSEPALPETEALAYLVTGGPLNQVSQANSDALAGAALSYGAGQASWLANKLGVGELNVEEGETLHDSLLAVGQYLTPDFYVGAKVGLFNKQAMLVLKHNIGKSINVETQTGTSQRIKLNYEFDRD
jgi:translocation and assembly module TamB